MAKMGFYDILTIECLNREYDVKRIGYRAVPDYENIVQEEVKESTTGKYFADKKREKKGLDKETLVVEPITVMRGHTGYLTFAIKF
jgi:tRNA A58 N-methylase Trm61